MHNCGARVVAAVFTGILRHRLTSGRARTGLITAGVALSLASSALAQPQEYTITSLNPSHPGIYNYSSGVAINIDGTVVGSGSGQFTTDLITVWASGQTIGTPVYYFSYNRTHPEGINDSGDIVGYGPDNASQPHGFFRGVDLGVGYTNAVNNRGQVAGWTFDSLYIWKDGVFDYQPTSYWGSEILSINDSGVAAGYWYTDCSSDCYGEVCIFRGDSITLLGTLSGGIYAEANDINNRGQLAGFSCTDFDCTQSRGFLWTDGNYVTIPTLGGARSEAHAVNDFGVVVGDAYVDATVQHAIIYDTARGLRDLNDLIPAGSGWELISASDINNYGQITGVGKYNGLTRAFLLSGNPDKFFKLVDGLGAPIPNRPVTITRINNDAPQYSEHSAKVDTTDDSGLIAIPNNLKPSGRMFKISTVVYQEPAVKGAAVLSNLYQMYLDNVLIDSLGSVLFDTTYLMPDSVREVIMFHTSIAANLVISIEWDAEVAYLTSLQAGLRLASNFLYDVTDGQAFLDTVFIFDRRAAWNQADVQIHSSTEQWPEAYVADRSRRWGAFSATPGKTLNMPRIFYFNNRKVNREADWLLYPYNWTVATTTYDPDGGGPVPPESRSYCPSRTLIHELGHYLFGFYDEYNDTTESRVSPGVNYGAMDDQLDPGNSQSSELSSVWQYQSAGLQVTSQWQVRGLSCWDWLEQDMGEVHDNIWCEIATPDEYNTPTNMVTGPNDNMAGLDYDVGSRLVFPVFLTTPLAQTKVVRVMTIPVVGSPVEAAKVNIKRQEGATTRIVKQGKTSTTGYLRIVGFQSFDEITSVDGWVSGPSSASAAAASTGFEWYFGEVVTSPALDTLIVEAKAVAGQYPMIMRWAGLGAQSGRFEAEGETQLPGDLNTEVFNQDGQYVSGTSSLSGIVYTYTVDTLGDYGDVVLTCRDDSGHYYTIPLTYVRAGVSPDTALTIATIEGDAELDVDSLSTVSGLSAVVLLSSPYPVVRTGLDEVNVAVSAAHGVSTWPAGPFGGAPRLGVRYDNDRLDAAAEASVRMFRWDTPGSTWSLVGGIVDTAEDRVTGTITDEGVYAVFTTQAPTDVNRDAGGGTRPFRFELHQNYPNPFNPSTTIEFNVPAASEVRLEIFNTLGRKVRSLVDVALPAGPGRVVWDGLDDRGRQVPSGVYFYRLKAGGEVLARKMLLLR